MSEDINWMIKKGNKSKEVAETKSLKKIEKSEIIKKTVGILKLGNIASSVLLEMILDERADRLDIDVSTITSGAKLDEKSIAKAKELIQQLDKDLVIVTTPNVGLKGPLDAIYKLNEKKKTIIVISDILKKEVQEEFNKKNIGYLIIKSDAMIGARREFLDPVEMVNYNSDLLKVLSIGGVINLLYHEIDKVLEKISRKENITLPQIIVTPSIAVKYAEFANPYAEAKARAALEIAECVAKINSEGCFKIEERLEYIPQVATGHEMMRFAAKLADEAREVEKSSDKVKRQPHSYEGEIQEKRTLTEKPTSKY